MRIELGRLVGGSQPKKRRLWLVCLGFLVLSSTIANAQDATELKKIVGFAFGTVHPRTSDGTPAKGADGKPLVIYGAMGTVFFVTYPDARGGPDFQFAYIVTAKHVLKDADGSFLKSLDLRLNLRSPGAEGYDFIREIPVTDDRGNLVWLRDPDDAVDVAALPYLPAIEKYDFKSIPFGMFVDDKLLKSSNVGEGDQVLFVGLMAQYYGKHRNYPVIRRGTLALMTDEKIDTPTGSQRAFIAELVSWPGNSGSPVLLNLGGLRGNTLSVGNTLHFLGLLSGSFLNRAQFTTLDATVTSGDSMNTGVTFIVPAEQIAAVLKSPAAQALRDAEIARRFPQQKN
jgi:hypothetical protein